MSHSRTETSAPRGAALTLGALLLLGLAGAAEGAVSTYRWQVQQSGAIGTSGYTANWPAACGAAPTIDNNLNPVVTTMSTAAFCGNDNVDNRRPAGPHQIFLMIKNTAYAGPTTVTGQATGNRWALEDQGGGGKTVRFTLGYAQGGTFTPFGFVDVVVADSTNGLFQPDMSGISGTAPSGSHLALLVTKQVGANNSRVIIYFADKRQTGDQSGQIAVDETAAGNTTTLGDGTDPAAASVCPSDPETTASQFTFVTDGNTDAVNNVTVSLSPAGSFNNLSQVRITTTGGVERGVVAPVTSDTLVIPLSGLSATPSLTPYEVRFTPKTDAAMPLPASGVSYAVTAPITAFTPATNSTAGSDNDTEATTVDNASPANVSGPLTGTPGDNQITVSWTDPADADFGDVIIVRKQGGALVGSPAEGSTYAVTDPVGDGTVVFVGTGASSPWTDTGVSNGLSYWYKVFARDTCANWSTGAEIGPITPQAPANDVTPGTATATGVQCDSVTLQAPFTGDANADSTTSFARKASATCDPGGYTAVSGCAGLSGASPRSCLDNTVAEQTTYCYEVTFSDGDGVNGTNPQYVGPVTTPACVANNTILPAGANSANASSCSQITTTSRFTGDANDDGSTLVEYRTPPGSGAYTTACSTLTGASPRQCQITGLAASTSYEVQFTFSDPDTVDTSLNLNPDTQTTSTLACGGDQVAPMLLVLSPARDAVLGGTDKARIQVWDAGAVTVEWSVDGGAFTSAGSAVQSCGTGCGIYEFDLDTSALSNSSHYFTIRARDSEATANEALLSRGFRVNNADLAGTPAGAGLLLRRTPGSQLCLSCHNMPTHSAQNTSTKRGNWAIECITCHTPHNTTNIYLIRETLRTPRSGKKTILFHKDDIAGGTNPGSKKCSGDGTTLCIDDNDCTGNGTCSVLPNPAGGEWGFLGDRSDTDNAPYGDGICEACHTRTNHHRNDASGGDHTHNAALRCLDCHAHDKGFQGSGACLDCHSSADQPGTTGPNNRRPVLADFSLNSHHVGVAGITTLKGNLTSFDCVVCHAEGKIDAGGEVTLTSLHNEGSGLNGNHVINLKHADDWDGAAETGFFSYDKYAICMSILGDPDPDTPCRAEGGGGTTALPGNWGSGNALWRTETSGELDPFCLSCHDSDGATASYNQNADDCGVLTPDAQNPFCDDALTNNYDQGTRPAVVDIRSKVDVVTDTAPLGLNRDGTCNGGTNNGNFCNVAGDCPGGTCFDPSGGRAAQGIADPPEGIYARHAIRSQAASVYSGTNAGWDTNKFCFQGDNDSLRCDNQADPAAFCAPGGGECVGFWNDSQFAWASNSVMGCADCHTVDGANASAGNAHGSGSEYLLKDVNGLPNEGVYNQSGGIYTYVCYRCHEYRRYSRGTDTRAATPRLVEHTDNDGDWSHTADLVGPGRATTGNDGNRFGIACLNCHGGGPGDPVDPIGFGAIHGNSETFGFGVGGLDGTRRGYRFTSGASQRYFNPDNDGNDAVNNWQDTQYNCFTLGGSGDSWGACTQHSTGSRTYERAFTRPLSY